MAQNEISGLSVFVLEKTGYYCFEVGREFPFGTE